MTYDRISLKIANDRSLNLATEMYQPKTKGTFPAVLLFHGFTGYKEEENLVDIADKLAQNGFVTIRFTASGFGDSDGTLTDDYRFSRYVQDAEAVYSYVRALPYIEVSRIGVVGHSMGGKLVVLFCAQHPEIRAGVVISSPVQFPAKGNEHMRVSWERVGFYEKVSGRDGKTIRVPYAYYLDIQHPSFDVLSAAERVQKTHVLVLAGEADTVVPWQDTKEVFDHLSCPKEFMRFKDITHEYKKNASARTLVHGPVIDWMQRWL